MNENLFPPLPNTLLEVGAKSVDLAVKLRVSRIESLSKTFDLADPHLLEHLVRIHAQTTLLPAYAIAHHQSFKLLLSFIRTRGTLPKSPFPLDGGAYWPLMPQVVFLALKRNGWEGNWTDSHLGHISFSLITPFQSRLYDMNEGHSHFFDASPNFKEMVLTNALFPNSPRHLQKNTSLRVFDIWFSYAESSLNATSPWMNTNPNGWLGWCFTLCKQLLPWAITPEDIKRLSRLSQSISNHPGSDISEYSITHFTEQMDIQQSVVLKSMYPDTDTHMRNRLAL